MSTTTYVALWTNVTDNPKQLNEDDLDTLRARVFGQLVKLTDGTLKHYQSDLYRDAMVLKERLQGECEFDFSWDSWGTWMIFGRPSEFDAHRENVAHIRVSLDRYTWRMAIDQVPQGLIDVDVTL